jgi:hypothetical protein
MFLQKETSPGVRDAGAGQVPSPALVWLSLVGLLASRARLRFTRRWEYSGHGGETEGGPRESRELSQRPGVIVVGEVKGRRCLG